MKKLSDGWKLVPREADATMIKAAIQATWPEGVDEVELTETVEKFVTMQTAMDDAAPSAPTAAIERVVGALNDLLALERRRAKLSGFVDCACINFSRDMERAYEAGQCPHQKAREALAALTGASEKASEKRDGDQ